MRRRFSYPAPTFRVDVIEDIETDFGLPVISNITSQRYVAFKAIGMREKINGYGKIMRMLARVFFGRSSLWRK
jgi:hypothetical protein